MGRCCFTIEPPDFKRGRTTAGGTIYFVLGLTTLRTFDASEVAAEGRGVHKMKSDGSQDESLMIIFNQSRQMTLSLLQDVSDAQARWLPKGEVNHLLWHGGHIFVLLERCIFAAVVGSNDVPPSIPEGWWTMFGWNSKPWEIAPGDWPRIVEVREALQAQTIQLQDQLASYDDAFLTSPIAWSDPRWTGRAKRTVILHGFFDELLHAGQMMQLKRLYDVDQAGAA